VKNKEGTAPPGGVRKLQEGLDSWFVRHVSALKTGMRMIVGVVWGIDGALKFQPGVASNMVGMIADAGASQPAWLAPWFNFWSQTVATNPAFFVTSVGTLEFALGLSLIVGVGRKVAYTGGFFLSLLIWSVPEGFGGPYGPGSTDIGTGIIYAFVFLFLLILNAAFGPSEFSLDAVIERRWPAWRRIAEVRSSVPRTVSPPVLSPGP
jgi:nitrite reductase (NO-forming)